MCKGNNLIARLKYLRNAKICNQFRTRLKNIRRKNQKKNY